MTDVNTAGAAPIQQPPGALQRLTQRRPLTPDERFRPLPAPFGEPPYRRVLADVIGVDAAAEIARAGELRFHCVGDTGGHRDPAPQRRVAAAMAAELRESSPARFFYHLGDVVYPHGEQEHYPAQFHAAYADYTAPIFAVPGNHDAENDLKGSLALAPFCAQFCSDTVPLHDAATASREPVRQPNVYWTLVHDWVRIVGLWANVPEGGQFASDQVRWLIGELAATPPDVTLILALHQPVVSADLTHGSNLALIDLLDDCAREAGRSVDAVFSGHAHVYERFTRRHQGREIPHIVAGAGGYPELHPIGLEVGPPPVRVPGLPDITLDAYEDTAHGFMTIAVRPGGAEVVYNAVGTDGVVRRADAFAITTPGSI